MEGREGGEERGRELRERRGEERKRGEESTFWQNISKFNNSKSTKYANTIGDCSGDDNITEMWRKHFQQLYNCVHDDGFQQLFYQRLVNLSPCTAIFNVHRVFECLLKQKKLARQLAQTALRWRHWSMVAHS